MGFLYIHKDSFPNSNFEFKIDVLGIIALVLGLIHSAHRFIHFKYYYYFKLTFLTLRHIPGLSILLLYFLLICKGLLFLS
jgi:hypothetical protein